jgi:hypothetical protein
VAPNFHPVPHEVTEGDRDNKSRGPAVFKLGPVMFARGSWWPGEFGRLKTASEGGRGRLLVAVGEGVNRGVKAAEDAAWRGVPACVT